MNYRSAGLIDDNGADYLRAVAHSPILYLALSIFYVLPDYS